MIPANAIDHDRGTAPLAVQGVEAGYTAAPILLGVSLVCQAGAITTIVGPNGCGKSTLLKAVVGLIPVRRGSIRIHGADVTGLAPEVMLRRGVALVPQIRGCFPRMSVEENLLLGAYLLDSRALRRERMDEIFTVFPRLGERRRQLAGTLSGGEQRFLELARALIMRPDILLLDEPSAMLAPGFLDDLFGEIRRIADRGTAVLLVEQNIRKAFEVTDRVYVFDYGTNFMDGTPRECMENPALASLFLG